MADGNPSSERRQWVLIIPIVIGFLLALVNLSEWYKTGITENTSGYPFGAEGPVPYYYTTPEMYAKVNFLFGLAFSFLTGFTIWAFIKNRKKIGLLFFALTLIIAAIMLMHGQSGL